MGGRRTKKEGKEERELIKVKTSRESKEGLSNWRQNRPSAQENIITMLHN